jgi:hypothetical protein
LRFKKHKKVVKSVSFRKVALYLFYLISILAFDLKIYQGYSAELVSMRSFSIAEASYTAIEQEKSPHCNHALSNRLSVSFHFHSPFSHLFLFHSAFLTTRTYLSFTFLDFIRYRNFYYHLTQYGAFLKRYINYCKLSI